MLNELTELQKQNFERLIFSIAILHAPQLGIDVRYIDEFSKLTEGQKTFAKKIYDVYPEFQKQVLKDERISEETIVRDTAKISQDAGDDLRMIVSVGDEKVCQKCKDWQNKIVSLSGTNRNYPSLQQAINDGFLHYNCRCALQDIGTVEIERKAPNPRASAQTKRDNPRAYNKVFSGHMFKLI